VSVDSTGPPETPCFVDSVVTARPQGEQPGEVRPTVTFSLPVKNLEMVEAQRAGDTAKTFAKIEPVPKQVQRVL
jgi:hypothetical protein